MLLDHLHITFKRYVLKSSVLHWYLLCMSTLTIQRTNIITIVYSCCTFGVMHSHLTVGKMIDFIICIIEMIEFHLNIILMIDFHICIIFLIDFYYVSIP